MKPRRNFLLSMTVMSLFVATASSAREKPPIVFGVILPLSGIGAVYGQNWKAAIDLALEDINKTGINGSKLEADIKDDQLNPQQSILLYKAMAAGNVRFVIGPNFSSTFGVIAPLAGPLKVPTFTTGAVKPGLAVKPWALRLNPADNTIIPQGLAEFKKKFPDVKNIVLAGDVKDAASAGELELFKAEAPNFGLTITDVIEYNTKVTDFSPYAIKIRGSNPDAVVLCSVASVSLQLLKELEGQKFDKPILLAPVALGGSVANEAGTAARNVFSMITSTNEPDGNPLHDNFVARMIERTRSNSAVPQPINTVGLVWMYDALLALADVIRTQGMDGNTPIQDVREKIQVVMNSPKAFNGIAPFSMLPSGDADYRAHLVRVDYEKRIWIYALPREHRIMN
jgi:branched-chain amino acid transport system substrate-binding protein